MVRSITVTGALALLALARAQAQIDFTPAESFYEVEGIRMPNVTFRDRAKAITYTPPADWVLSGGGAKLLLTPRDAVQAGATMETRPVQEPALPPTEENVKAYTDLAMAAVPREATKIEIVEAGICPMRISGAGMIEVTLSYSFFGQPYRMNVLFMPREREQLRFQCVARAADYPEMFKTFRSSLFSMQGF